MTSTKPRVNKISTVVIPVSDQARATEFYTRQLGFEKRIDVPLGPEEGYRWVEVAPADAATTIAVVPPPPGRIDRQRRNGHRAADRRRRCLPCRAQGQWRDVDSEVSRMGHLVPPRFWLRDPEGNTLMVVQ